MTVVIFTKKRAPSFGFDRKTAAAVRIEEPAALGRHNPEEGELSYLDISGLSGTALKRAAALLKKRCGPSPWGILDPKGEVPDPAAFFYEGASDYAGPKAVKTLSLKRVAAAAAWRSAPGGPSGTAKEWRRIAGTYGTAGKQAKEPREAAAKILRLKIPSGKFPGWRSVTPGSQQSFFFLFVSLSGADFRSRLGEGNYRTVRNRLRELLQHRLRDADALLWMETETNSLYLVPPRIPLIRAAVTASLKTICAAPLIGIEKLGLPFPISFTFALHYGKTIFRAPGGTGTVVSGAVNYIFHLGTKCAEPDRLTISEDIGDGVIPPGLDDLFVDAGEFEDISIRHSRRFVCSRER
ncbi:MAG: hypothetical protein LBP23_08325 [Treponema sp.]|jgi:hypothetical protein|nr:hypothetical protein [Treponema sp.]